jgi:ABC-type glycerol-3-phosphate transport system substrate-binding protein
MLGQKKPNRFTLSALLMLTMVFGACTTETQVGPTPAEPSPSITPTSSASNTAVPPQSGEVITIWVPSFLAPDEDTHGGKLFFDQIKNFEEEYPDVDIQIRVKDEDGPAGLLETLTAANAAAPSALPDIVALDPVSLNTAALKGIVIPLKGIYAAPSLPDWYQHAVDSVYIGENFFGIPFASDTDVFAYRQKAFETSPLGWADLLSGTETFLFPGGDKEASFTLAQYLSLDGTIRNEDGNPDLEKDIVREILEFYSTAAENGLLPLSTLQYRTSDGTWDFLRQFVVSSAVIPLRVYLQQAPGETFNAQPLPTSDGDGIVLTRSYSWSIVVGSDEHHPIVNELLSWLMRPEFLGPWANALGMLPTTSEALSHWPSEGSAALVNQLVRVAIPSPNAEIFATLGPPLQNALEEVLFTRSTPNAAALSAVQQVRNTSNGD